MSPTAVKHGWQHLRHHPQQAQGPYFVAVTDELTADTIATAKPVLIDGVTCEPLTDDHQRLRLHGPLIQRRPPMTWLARWFHLPERLSVELDDIGSWVVQRMGHADMRTLARDLAHEWRLTRREAEGSLTIFVKSLLNRRLIRLEQLESSRSPDG